MTGGAAAYAIVPPWRNGSCRNEKGMAPRSRYTRRGTTRRQACHLCGAAFAPVVGMVHLLHMRVAFIPGMGCGMARDVCGGGRRRRLLCGFLHSIGVGASTAVHLRWRRRRTRFIRDGYGVGGNSDPTVPHEFPFPLFHRFEANPIGKVRVPSCHIPARPSHHLLFIRRFSFRFERRRKEREKIEKCIITHFLRHTSLSIATASLVSFHFTSSLLSTCERKFLL